MPIVTDPGLISQLDSKSAAPAQSSNIVTDPKLISELDSKASPQDQEPSIKDQAIGMAKSAGAGLAYGAVKGVQDLGTLAKNILGNTIGRIVPDAVNKFAKSAYDTNNQAMNYTASAIKQGTQDIRDQNPVSGNVGETAGYVGSQLAGMGKALGAVGDFVAPTAKAITPGLAANPIVTNAISQSALGAGIGAASDSEHPVQGALQGAGIGAVFGGLSGAAGESARVGGKIIQNTVKDQIASGQDPHSLESLRKVQSNLKDEGVVYRLHDVRQMAKTEVNDQLEEMRPDGFIPGNSPIKTIAARIEQNYPKVVAQNEENYAPINNAEQTFTPKNYNEMLDKVQNNLPKIGLPGKGGNKGTPALPDQPTLNDMLSYRKQLDGTIKQAQAQAANGKISNSDVIPYYQLRQSLNQDVHQSADSIGLGEQLQKAESYNQQNVQPFKTIDKQGNIVDNPKAESKIWGSISQELQARRPNFEKIRQNAAMLGPDGKELVGWGVQENAFNRAVTLSGEYKPEMHQSALTRMNATGLLDEVSTPTQKAVARATSNILERTMRTIPKPAEQGYIGKALNGLTKSRAGIAILKRIGSPTESGQVVRSLSQQLITGILSHQANSSNDETDDSNQ